MRWKCPNPCGTPPRLRREWRRAWCIMTAGSGTCSAKVWTDGATWGFAVLPNAAGGPVVSLTYETEAEARAHALMAKNWPTSRRMPSARPYRAAGRHFLTEPSPRSMPVQRARMPPQSPDRQASLARCRRQARSGVVPAKIAASFTMAEAAVLTVIARQCPRACAP